MKAIGILTLCALAGSAQADQIFDFQISGFGAGGGSVDGIVTGTLDVRDGLGPLVRGDVLSYNVTVTILGLDPTQPLISHYAGTDAYCGYTSCGLTISNGLLLPYVTQNVEDVNDLMVLGNLGIFQASNTQGCCGSNTFYAYGQTIPISEKVFGQVEAKSAPELDGSGTSGALTLLWALGTLVARRRSQ